MNRLTKALAVSAAAIVIGFGGITATTANAATNEEIATYLTDAVAAQLGLTTTDTLHQLIVDAMANNLIDPAVTEAAGASVDGISALTPDELAALLDANLTQQLGTIEQTLIDLGVYPDPDTPVDPPVDPPVVTNDDDDDLYDDHGDDGEELDDDHGGLTSDDDDDDDLDDDSDDVDDDLDDDEDDESDDDEDDEDED